MKFYTNCICPSEVADVIRAFGFEAELYAVEEATLTVDCDVSSEVLHVVCRFDGKIDVETASFDGADALQRARLEKRYAKMAAYRCLKEACHRSLPWGALTGIRPTRLAAEIQTENLDYQKVFATLFDVRADKIQLVEDILTQQKGLKDFDPKAVDLYVGVPFCVSKCTYCSFSSGVISKLKDFVEPFVSAVSDEISQTLQLIDEHGLRLKNVYFGGGTPTSLTASQLKTVFDVCPKRFGEWTVEAGRPDTLDEDKLKLFADFGVNRLSVNPQTFNQSVLDCINRRHSVQDVYDKFFMARKYPFAINMDLIAGLPSETKEMFMFSVNEAAKLAPDDVTVHTLALKKGSALKEEKFSGESEIVSAMVDFAHDTLCAAGYNPYYMYRQKYMSDNLENVGYCKDGKQGLYNVDNMEETTSILACGANAISKRIFGEGRIERVANPKDVQTYLNYGDKLVERKKALFNE